MHVCHSITRPAEELYRDSRGLARSHAASVPSPDLWSLLLRSSLARYFKFKSVDDLAAESRQLGLDLRFSDDLSPLFRPVRVGPLRVGNSLCIQPMEGCDGSLDGRPGELTFRRYRRFGAGGAKLIWGEAAAVLEEGRANPRQLLVNEETAPALEQMLLDCRAAHR